MRKKISDCASGALRASNPCRLPGLSCRCGCLAPLEWRPGTCVNGGMDAEFLPAGIDRAALKPLARRSDGPGLIRLAGHAGTLAATGALVLLAAGRPLLLV